MPRLLVTFFCCLLTACASTGKHSSQTLNEKEQRNCFAYYQQQLGQVSMIWGFGDSAIRSVAIDAARADLAKQITVHISTKSEVRESNISADFASLSRSIVDQHLDGVQVERVCHENGKYQVLVKIPRQQVARAAEQKVKQLHGDGKQILTLLQREGSKEQRIQNLVQARNFLASEGELYRSQMSICQIFQGCRLEDDAWLGQLKALVQENNFANTFVLHPEDKIAEDLQAEITSFLLKEGYQISNSAPEQLASASCHRQVFERSQDLREHLVKLHCQIVGQVEGVKVFQLSLSATGFGSTPEQAFQVARTLLEKDESKTSSN
ncbi:MAG: hypothetical protein ACOH5I_18700 [Oligoflexus sp.]